MSKSFEISVKINDKSFDLCININKSLINFSDILPKIKEVVKIGAKEDIDFQTHDFEAFKGKVCLQISAINHIIRSGSVITIRPKHRVVLNRAIVGGLDSRIDRNSDKSKDIWRRQPSKTLMSLSYIEKYSSDESYLMDNQNEIQEFYSIVLAINIGWDFRTAKDVDIVWDKVRSALIADPTRTQLISSTLSRTLFKKWINYYVDNYHKLDAKIDSLPQSVFNLLKVIHTLDLNQFYRYDHKIVCKIERINATQELRDYFNRNLTKIRVTKMNENSSLPQNYVSKRNRKKRNKFYTNYTNN